MSKELKYNSLLDVIIPVRDFIKTQVSEKKFSFADRLKSSRFVAPRASKAYDELFKLIMPYIEAISMKYPYIYREDCVQAGCIAAMKALDNYKKGKNAKFTTYLYKYVNEGMKAVIPVSKLSVSSTYRRQHSLIKKTTTKFVEENRRSPTLTELRELTGLSLDVLKRRLSDNYSFVSIEKAYDYALKPVEVKNYMLELSILKDLLNKSEVEALNLFLNNLTALDKFSNFNILPKEITAIVEKLNEII